MSAFYLTSYSGRGTERDPFRPRVEPSEWTGYDLRPDATKRAGLCLVEIAEESKASGLTLLGLDERDRVPAVYRRRLGVVTLGAMLLKLGARLPARRLPTLRERWQWLGMDGQDLEWLVARGIAPLMGGAALATYNFNATFNPLTADSGNWAVITGEDGGIDANDTVAGRGNFTPTGADKGLRYIGGGVTWPNNQYAQAKIWVDSTSGGTGPGVVIRSGAAAQTYMRSVASHAASGNVKLTKIVTGSFTDIWSRTQAFTDADVLYLEGQGTAYVVKLTGSAVGASATDSDVTAGNPGICLSTNVTTASIDDFEGGDFAGAGTSLTPTAGAATVTSDAPGRVIGTVLTPLTP